MALNTFSLLFLLFSSLIFISFNSLGSSSKPDFSVLATVDTSDVPTLEVSFDVSIGCSWSVQIVSMVFVFSSAFPSVSGSNLALFELESPPWKKQLEVHLKYSRHALFQEC